MLKNYSIVAWRTLVRNKIYSLVNVLGLALGICSCLVIYLITRYEFSFDTFHPNGDRIFCVDAEFRGRHLNAVPGPMSAAMRQDMTGLESIAAFLPYEATIRIPNDEQGKSKHFKEDQSIAIAEPQYFDIFQYKWLSGNAATSLKEPFSVVLTAEKAKQYFGDLDPDNIIGRTIYYHDSLMVTVTGIVADWKNNTDFSFTQWISYATIPVSFLKKEIRIDDWNSTNRFSQVMVKLAKDVKPLQMDKQLAVLTKQDHGQILKISAQLRPLSGIHFHSDYGGGSRKASLPVLYTLMAVAGFILLLAIVNFVNLSTAQSMQRAREIGVRKVLGGSRSGIAVQFFTETLALTVAAMLLAVLMLKPVLNLFADLIPAGIHFSIDIVTILFLLLITAATTLLAGFYPAKVLGRYQPTVTLKGITAVPGGGKGGLRKGLIVFQFTISLLFIIASIVIGAQLRYALHTDLGFKTDAILTLSRPPADRFSGMRLESDREQPPQKSSEDAAKITILMNTIRQLAGVETVIRQWIPPIGRMHMEFGGGGLKNSNDPPIEVSSHYGDADYLPFYGMKLVAGRNMLPGDSTKELLISETFAHALGFADVSKAIGREVRVDPANFYPVAGVVADFFECPFDRASSPIVIRHDPSQEKSIAVKIAAQRMTAGELKNLIEQIEKEWKAIFPGQPLSYAFLDESIAKMYEQELRTELLINTAMAITVFISCLGLFGLAIFSTEKRAREIGIRKVLGATVSNIMVMLCKEIVQLILLALLIATPLAWYAMHEWLQAFAYRTPLSVWIFMAAGVVAIGIALLTVGFQAMRTAIANPVETLRTE